MEQTSTYTIKIQNFEGPLDLLFHLIEKNKMNIYDIQLVEITDQYIEYINKMEELDLEVTSEFLVMASTLLFIKSRMLLPEANRAEEEEEDPKEELINRLIEYKKYKEFTKELKDREVYYSQLFYKPQELFKIKPEKIINQNYLPGLIPSVYKEICERNIRKINQNRTSITSLMEKEKVTLRSKVREIVKVLLNKARFKFSELFTTKNNTKLDIAAAFMALLELAKAKRVKLEQKESYGEIIVKKLRKKKKRGLK